MSQRPLKNIADSRMSQSEIVGEQGLMGQRMQAGAILDLIDMISGRIAHRHSGSQVTTLSFDRVDLVYPIHHMDLVRLDGNMVAVGNSSMLICVQGYRKDSHTRAFLPIQRAYVTFVAIDANRRANRDIPGLRYASADDEAIRAEGEQLKQRSAAWVRMQAEGLNMGPLRAEAVEQPLNRDKTEYLTPLETEIVVTRQFMPRNLNQAGTIFGGDILNWMDRVATYTARHFTRNPHVVTIAMNRIFFRQPIFPTDLVRMVSRVVYVRRYTMEVEINVYIERDDGQEVASHSGYFTVLNYDESGFKRAVVTGLRLSDADQDGLLRYFQAHERHKFWRQQDAVSTNP